MRHSTSILHRGLRLHPLLLALLFGFFLLPTIVDAQQPEDQLYLPPQLVVSDPYGEIPAVRFYGKASPMNVPLLPKIFFDNPGEWVIPERFVQFRSPTETRDYRDTNDFASPVGLIGKYREILNIIGDRMRRMPSATLALRGGYSMQPGETPEIGRIRCEVVTDYLANVWEIDRTRISIVDPVCAVSSEANLARQQEAQSVTFLPSHPGIVAPIDYCHIVYSQNYASLDMHILPNIDPQRVAKIEVFGVDEKGRVIAGFGIRGSPDSSVYRAGISFIYWGNDPYSLSLKVRVTDTQGEERESEAQVLHPEIREFGRTKRTVSHIAVPFFDAGSATLSRRQKQLLRRSFERADSLLDNGHPRSHFISIRSVSSYDEDPAMAVADVATYLNAKRAVGDRHRLRGNVFRLLSPQYNEAELIDVPVYSEGFAFSDSAYQASLPLVPTIVSITKTASSDFHDSLGEVRVSGIIDYITDTLNIALLNDLLLRSTQDPPEETGLTPPNEAKTKKGQQARTVSGSENQVILSGPYPEERQYNRTVSIRLQPEDIYQATKKFIIESEAELRAVDEDRP